jgi:hypothetical protein
MEFQKWFISLSQSFSPVLDM